MMLLASFMNSIKLTALNFSENYQFRLKQNEVINYIFCINKLADIINYRKNKPFIIVECKAPSIKINQETIDQIDRYNMKLDADYLMVSNGFEHYFCQMDYEYSSYVFLPELPTNPNFSNSN